VTLLEYEIHRRDAPASGDHEFGFIAPAGRIAGRISRIERRK